MQRPAALLSARLPRLSQRFCCLLLTSALLLVIGMVLCGAVCSAVDGAVSFCPGIPDRLSRLRAAMRASGSRAGTDAWGRFVRFSATGAEWCLDFFSLHYRQYLPSLLRRSASLAAALPAAFTATVFGILAALFACGNYAEITRTVRDFLPPQLARELGGLLRTTLHTLTRLLRTYGILMAVTFAELALGFAALRLAGFRAGNILSLALLISLIDILPVLGTGTVLIPWGLFECLTGSAVYGGLLLGMSLLIGLVRNVLEPRLMAGQLALPPFFALAGVYIGGRLFGASGVIVLPLAMVILRSRRDERKT